MKFIEDIRTVELNNEPNKVMEKYLELRPELLEDELLAALFGTREFFNLAEKTQVTQQFIRCKEVATRLTHTLEVNGYAEYIAGKLGVDVTNIRRIALFHDVGHLPFGHVGEKTIKNIIRGINKSKTIFSKLIPEEDCAKFDKYGDLIYKKIGLDEFHKFVMENHETITTEECEILAKALGIDTEVSRRMWLFGDIEPLPFKHADVKVMEHILCILKDRGSNIFVDTISEEGINELENYNNFCHEKLSYLMFKRIIEKEYIEMSQEDFEIVADGILKHGNGSFNASSIEGKIVGISDKMAFITRDIEDAMKLGFELDFPKNLGETPDEIRKNVLDDLLLNSNKETLKLSDDVNQKFEKIKKYMYENFYGSYYLSEIDKNLATHIGWDFFSWVDEIRDCIEDEDYSQSEGQTFSKTGCDVREMYDMNNLILEFAGQSDVGVLNDSEMEILEHRFKDIDRWIGEEID